MFPPNTVFPELPLRFEQGHAQYLELWEYLFSYEVYSILLNSRRSESKDEKPNSAGLEASQPLPSFQTKKQLMWVGYCVSGKQKEMF